MTVRSGRSRRVATVTPPSKGGGPHEGSSRPTAERILYESSLLFATKGYFGTSTRAIAAAVGVRQPSLFHHFESKAAILEVLLAHSLDEATGVATVLSREGGPAAPRLYRYMRWDLAYLHRSPYNLVGIHTDDVMNDERFGPWRHKRDLLHGAIRRMVEQGVATGEFHTIDPLLAQEMITGVALANIRVHNGRRVDDADLLADWGASFVLRGLLVEPVTLDGVRSEVGAKGLDP